ncbi:TetR/AcrR family transcriptional regulator [Microbacterium sp. UBA3394]|uniref:TetR/AcrR family transcriptional regulator n=1 Tax=Microbacterium sp. UBA3394 TaxID=1946945 RepID=UPI00257BF7BA|nr:TetR/AcrR family transcriptional regulator [Microbacterium sp. UBA3394]
MSAPGGRREQKKRETRGRLADVAARLFAERGYDAVAMTDVARAAGVADQTVYNYFPTKPDLVLDLAEEMLERSRRAVAERAPDQTPADAFRELVHQDIDDFLREDPSLARGEYPAQSVQSDVLRRYALRFRHDQADAIAAAITSTDPDLPPLVARAHASVLVTVIQAVTDRVGAAVLSGTDLASLTEQLHIDADVALVDAAENFRATKRRMSAQTR